MSKSKNISPKLEKKIWEYFQSSRRRPISIQELIRELNLSKNEGREVRRYLKREAQRGTFIPFKKGKFMLSPSLTSTSWEEWLTLKGKQRPEEESEPQAEDGEFELTKTVEGILEVHPEGYAFLRLEDGSTLFVPPHLKGPALHGDKVKALEYPHSSKGSIAEVKEIIEPFSGKLVGQLFSIGGQLLFQDEARRYPMMTAVWRESRPKTIPPENHWVLGELVRSPFEAEHYWFEIEKFLEAQDGPELDRVRSVALLEADQFPPQVLEEAKKLAVEPDRKEFRERLDLRHLTLFTIDGDDAYDFDDAVGIKILSNGKRRVYVAISDVAHYVREDSPLDLEARRRGTSVYFPKYCLPMLPDPLSNEVCSLKPNRNRLALLVSLDFDQKGRRIASNITEALIQSKARLTYNQVNELFEKGENLEPNHPTAPFKKDLLELLKLTKQLRKKRLARGSLDLDLPEPEITFDPKTDEITDIKARERNWAHFLIEELMLQTNEEIAIFFAKRELPTIYRVHPPPNPEEVAKVISILSRLGLSLPPELLPKTPDEQEKLFSSPKYLNKLLSHLEGHKLHQLFHQMLLTSLKQASYNTDNIGHFGLALEYYLHFTSPIRRYPDLCVHRLLKQILKKELPTDQRSLEKLEDKLADIAEHSSKRERMAIDAERAVLARYRARFLRKYIGEEFDGFVSSVVPFGIFVMLEKYFADGLVHISKIPGFYYYDSERLALIEQSTGKTIQVGDRVKVRIANASPISGKVDFDLLELLPPK